MALVKTDSLIIETDGIRSVLIKSNLLSYLPRALTIVTFGFALITIANIAGETLDLLGSEAKTWDKIFSTVGFLLVLGLALLVAFASIKITGSSELDEESVSVVSWALGIGVVFGVFAAALSYSNISAAYRTGGMFASDEQRIEFFQQENRNAMQAIGVTVALGLAFASLRLLGRRDVIISRDTGVEKLTNIDHDTALSIRDAIVRR